MSDDDEPPLDEVPDEELVNALEEMFHAQELRDWMSAHDLERSRGANKHESATQAVAQDRDGIARFLYEEGALDLDWDRRCEHHGACGNTTAGPNVAVCDACLDVSRRNSSADDPLAPDDFPSMTEYMAALHERHD